MRTVPSPILPHYPCDECGHIAWARMPLIGGQECVCTVCHPVRTWSHISEADFQAAHTKRTKFVPKFVQLVEEEAA